MKLKAADYIFSSILKMLTLDLNIKHPNRVVKHLNLLWSTRIDGISPEIRGDQIINDAKNDNLNDPRFHWKNPQS